MSERVCILQPDGTTRIEKSVYESILSNIWHLVPGPVRSLTVDVTNHCSSRHPAQHAARRDIFIRLAFAFKEETAQKTVNLCLTLLDEAGKRSVFLMEASFCKQLVCAGGLPTDTEGPVGNQMRRQWSLDISHRSHSCMHKGPRGYHRTPRA